MSFGSEKCWFVYKMKRRCAKFKYDAKIGDDEGL